MSSARVVLVVVLVTACVRLALAATTGLGIDESYMVAAGRTLHVSYFDHPPLSWWLSRLAALAAGSEAPVVVRLPFIALFAVSTWLMYRLGARLFGERAGMWAAVALNLSPVFGVTTATWVLPDGPLVCALLAMAVCFVKALTRTDDSVADWGWWLGAGLAAGMALLSKYSAALVLAGAVVFLITSPGRRKWLARPHPYVAALVAVACFAPVVAWNARHGWASLGFQGARAVARGWQPFGPLATLAGEAAFLLPWIWLPMMIAWIAAVRAGPASWRTWLPACLGAGPVVLFVAVSAWAPRILFHWAAPGYLMLFPLLGAWADRAAVAWPRLFRAALHGTVALVCVGVALLIVEAQVNVIPFGGDPGFQATDWTPLRPELAARGLLDRPGTVFAGVNWQDAGKLDYGLGGAAPVIVLNPDARQYLFAPGPAAHDGQDVLIVGPRLTAQRLAQSYGDMFERIEELPPLTLRGTAIGVFLGRRLRTQGVESTTVRLTRLET